jgi:hypothetical protein
MKSTFRSKLMTILFAAFCAVVLILGLRGNPGNPTSTDLNTRYWKEDGPMELSPERGRFALLYSIIEDKSFYFSDSVAKFTTPDLGFNNGHFVSLFAPGVSFLAMPGYLVGKFFNASQVGAFAMVAVFALINMLLVRGIAIRLGASKLTSSIGAAAVLFGTPAFAYAGTLYQHHISTFLILFSIYILIRWNNFWSLAAIWFLIALSIPIDYPNLIMMIPVGLVALGRIISFREESSSYKLQIEPLRILTVLAVTIPIAGFLLFNRASYDNPFQLSGTIRSVEAISDTASPSDPDAEQTHVNLDETQDKNALGFFQTRNIVHGFYIHLFSPDRGIIFYAPIVIFGIIGLVFLNRKHPDAAKIFVSIIGLNVLLYSMWGDPQGGWAFGSRYLIPSYLMLGLGVAFFLSRFKKNYFLMPVFAIVMIYSVWVNSLGAVTTNTNPPLVEIPQLEQKTGKDEKYTFERNWDYLKEQGSKSFVYRSVANKYMTATQYQLYLTILISAPLLVMLAISAARKEEGESHE